MNIKIYVNKKKINPLYQKAAAEYIKRLTPFCRLDIICNGKIPASLRTGSCAAYSICCTDEDSKGFTSTDFAASIEGLMTGGISEINYYIGYGDVGHANRISLCTLKTTPDMSALLLTEQIYRAFTILNHITYHK